MKTKKTIQTLSAILAMVFILTGCSSVRVTSTLKTDSKMKNRQVADGVKFSIVYYKATRDGEYVLWPHPIVFNNSCATHISIKTLSAHASEIYPRVFGNDMSNLPLYVHLDFESDIHKWGMIPQILTLGIIPFPSWANVDFTININDSIDTKTVSGWYQKTDYFTHKYSWWHTWTPLGLLPIPGFSEVRRTSNLMGNTSSTMNEVTEYSAAIKKLMMDSLTESITRCIKRLDSTKLKNASEYRKTRFKQFNINGQTFWTFLWYDNLPRDIDLELYSKLPEWGTKPFAKVTVAKWVNGEWQPVSAYLRSMKEATIATVLLVDGKPSKVVIKKVDNPPLEDFIELPSGSSSGDIRRNNGILIDIKSLTLPQLIQEKDAKYMIKLVIRIEKAVLRLNENAQKMDSKVQKEIVTGGKIDTSQLSEMSTLCRQRIAIFKPILSALKQAIAVKEAE